MIVKIQEDGHPMSYVYHSAFNMSVDKTGRIVVWANDTDGNGYKEVFDPSSYSLIIEQNDDAKEFYRKYM